MKTHVFIKINDSKKETNKERKTVHFQSNTLESLLGLRLVEEQWSRCRLLGMQQIESSKWHLLTITMIKSVKDMWHFCLVLHRWQRYTFGIAIILLGLCLVSRVYRVGPWVSQGPGFGSRVFWSFY